MQPSGARQLLATQANASYQRIRNWIEIVEGLSLLAVTATREIRLSPAQPGEAREQRAALARSVEDRSLELRREVEERRQVEDLHRSQGRILEMLTEPNDLAPEEILQYLAETVASRNADWECAVHLLDRRGKLLQLAASSGVTEPLKTYLRAVGASMATAPNARPARPAKPTSWKIWTRWTCLGAGR